MTKIPALIGFAFFTFAAQAEFTYDEQIACRATTIEKVRDLERRGFTVDVERTMDIYQICADENAGESYY
ncbi:MAG TPA: hypothetical protein PKC28_12615, partial [Bdellovibrionales bacterium]|nr:hypothetical protein [Bdellovibrionales bacterium]